MIPIVESYNEAVEHFMYRPNLHCMGYLNFDTEDEVSKELTCLQDAREFFGEE